jgi:hypothetical protein
MSKAKPPQERFFKKVLKTDSCWIWVGCKFPSGYGSFSLRKDGLVVEQRAHRVSYILHKGDIPKGLFVCHTCDNPACVNPDHLWLGTHQQNNQDKVNKKRHAFG